MDLRRLEVGTIADVEALGVRQPGVGQREHLVRRPVQPAKERLLRHVAAHDRADLDASAELPLSSTIE